MSTESNAEDKAERRRMSFYDLFFLAAVVLLCVTKIVGN